MSETNEFQPKRPQPWPENLDDTLERIIDGRSLSSVLDSLSRICDAKAEHVRAVWQDAALARHWERMARRIDVEVTVANRNQL